MERNVDLSQLIPNYFYNLTYGENKFHNVRFEGVLIGNELLFGILDERNNKFIKIKLLGNNIQSLEPYGDTLQQISLNQVAKNLKNNYYSKEDVKEATHWATKFQSQLNNNKGKVAGKRKSVNKRNKRNKRNKKRTIRKRK